MASEPVTVVNAIPSHAVRLAPQMRREDKAEIRASHGLEPLQCLLQGIEASTICRTVLVGNEVGMIFGVQPLDALAGVGCVWGLSGDAVSDSPFAFLRASKQQIEDLLDYWPNLYCAIDARYTKAIRWAKWLGFHVADAIPMGLGGLPFHPAFLRRQTWVS